MPEPELRVLESFNRPRATTNPYIVMLYEALREVCEVEPFSWRSALRGNYNVFHFHWPEILLRSDRLSRRVARRAAFWYLLQRLKSRNVAVVRTMHNLKPHETPSRIDSWLLGRLDILTTAWIRLNPVTSPETHTEVTTILLGHYLDWFEEIPDIAAEPHVIGNFGLIRPYKGVAELVTAAHTSNDAQLRLVVMGEPATTDLRDEITTLAAGDPRITLNLNHVDDGTLAREVRRCSLIVLPHHNMHNSSSLLLALSLDRPVLVPDTPVTRHVQQEVGDCWVYLYDQLTAKSLEHALDRATHDQRSPHPDLSARDWAGVAAAHIDVFTRALQLKASATSQP